MRITSLLALTLSMPLAACVTHTHATDYHGVRDIRGAQVEYQTTSVYAVHVLWFFGIIGDSSTKKGVLEFTKEAAARGTKRARIIETQTNTYWWVLPPFSFLVQPVETIVEGEVEVEEVDE